MILVLVVASVQLSTARLSFGTVWWGTVQLWRGHGTVLRAAAIEPGTGGYVEGTRMELVLRDARGERARMVATGDGVLDLPLAVPADLGRGAELALRVEAGGAVEDLTVRVEATDAPGPMRGSLVPFPARAPPGARRPAHDVALYPMLGTLVLGLENRVTARFTRDGRPVRVPVTLAGTAQGESDELGLWQLWLTPRALDETLTLTVDGETVRLVTRPRPAQLTVELGSRLVQPGSEVELDVRTLPFRDAVRADLWVGGALVSSGAAPASAEPTRSLVVRLPADARGLARLDVYRGDSAAEGVPLSLALWASTAGRVAAAGEALAALATLPGGPALLVEAQRASGEARARLVELALTRFVPDEAGVPLLRSSLSKRAAALADRVARLRQHVHTVLALTVAAGALVGGAWAVRRRRKLRAELAAALADGDTPAAAEDVAAIAGLRHRQRLDLVLVLATVGLFVYALLGLLRALAWGW